MRGMEAREDELDVGDETEDGAVHMKSKIVSILKRRFEVIEVAHVHTR